MRVRLTCLPWPAALLMLSCAPTASDMRPGRDGGAAQMDAQVNDSGAPDAAADGAPPDATLPPGPSDAAVDASHDAGIDAAKPDPLACVAGMLAPGNAISNIDFATPSNAPALPCATGKSKSQAFLFESRRAGLVAFSLEGESPSAKPRIAVFEDCAGSVLECHADPLAKLQEVVSWVEPGRSYVVVVESAASEPTEHAYTLRTEAIDCPTRDLGQLIQPAFVNTTGPSKRQASCGGEAHGEQVWRFRAKEAGAYRFESEATFFTPLLSLQEGARCGGDEISCAFGMGALKRAVVGAHLEAGQEINVLIDGSDGAGIASLDVTRVIGDLRCEVPNVVGLRCYDSGSVCEVDVPTENSGYPQRIASSCASSAGNPNAVADLIFPGGGGDGCSTRCDVTVSGSSPFTVARYEGGCNTGNEESCEPALAKGPGCDFESGAAFCSEFQLRTDFDVYSPERHVSLVMTPLDDTPQTYAVSVACIGVCR